MVERRAETIDRKDIMAKVDNLTIKVAEGFARNDAQGEAINRRLDQLNGKVAEQERIVGEMRLADGVNKVLLNGVQKKQDDNEVEQKETRSMTKSHLVGALIGIVSMGLVSLITFYLTYKR